MIELFTAYLILRATLNEFISKFRHLGIASFP